MRFRTCNIRSLYRKGSLKTVMRELEMCKLDLMGTQVRWEEGGSERAEDYTFFYGQGSGDHQLETGFFVHKRILSAVRREEFISDRLSYIKLRGRWMKLAACVVFIRVLLLLVLKLKAICLLSCFNTQLRETKHMLR
jgi:hypothetical protein